MPVAEGLIPPPNPFSPGAETALESRRARTAAAVGAAVLLASLLARIANLGQALPGGAPRLGPFDDLYHAFRMNEAMTQGGGVAGFDPGRGPRGAFCPWPPLYDTAAGSAARLLGAADTPGLLQRVFWFPPLAGSLFAAAAAFLLVRRLGPWSGLLGGLAAALTPPFLEASVVGAIDHHFLEPMLLVAVLWATIRLGRAAARRELLGSGLLLAAVISLALFVQPALLLAAGASMAAVLVSNRADEKVAGAVGFLLAAIAVLLYRSAQPTGYPDGSWYLGTPHAACLAGAAAACAGSGYLSGRGAGGWRATLPALVLGALVVAGFRGAVESVFFGARFLRGDPWLDTIIEFQPLFFRGWAGVPESLAALGGGALLALAAAPAFLAAGGARRRIAVFALLYLAATVATRRFLVPSTPLLALAGAVAFSDLWWRGARRTAVAAAALLAVPAVWGAWPLLREPRDPVPRRAVPILAAAQALRQIPGGGRLLSSWSWGHAFHIVGGRPVVVDNFGSSIGQTDFQNALGIVLSPREEAVAAYCRQTGVRFVVLENPLSNLTVQAQSIGLSPSLFVRADPGAPPQITPRMRFSFWWRAYFDRGGAIREPGRDAAAFRHFRLVYADAESVGNGRFGGPAVEIWELREHPLP